MKAPYGMRRVVLLLAMSLLVALALPATAMAAQPLVGMGTANNFAVLGGSTITNTGPTVIFGSQGGDAGVSPGSAFTGQGTVVISGAVHLADAVALQAQSDLTAAYNDAAGRTPITTIPTELGGTTLTPGVYVSESGTFQITGPLTLDAQGDPNAVFIFKTASTLITASGSSVKLINNAQPCDVFWQVGSSATLGTFSQFVGHVMALTSTTANTGATIQGQLLARNGAVTLDTNTINNALNEPAPPNPAIHVTKTASPSSLVGTGTVAYVYLVSNPGNVPVSGLTVADDVANNVAYVSGDTNGDGILQPAETWVYRATADLTATTTNTVTVNGSANGTPVTATATATVNVTPAAPAIHITKSASPTSLIGSGTVTYTYTVTNPGNVPLSSVTVTDNLVTNVHYVSGDTNNDGILQPGETWIFSGSAVVGATTTNTATANSSYGATPVTDTATATVNVTPAAPAIHVTKSPSPTSLIGSGTVTYTYRVTNPGNVPMSGVTVTDDMVANVHYVSGDTNNDGILQPGETWIFTGSAVLTATTTNTATASGNASGTPASDTASATVVVTPATGGVHITKTACPGSLPCGPGNVTYTYKVTNTGTVPLSKVCVTDDKVGNVRYVSGDKNCDNQLQPGETWIYTATTYLSCTTTNTASVKACANGAQFTDEASCTVVVTTPSPVIHITETASPGSLPRGPGNVTYTYKVTNPGSVALSKVTVTDDNKNCNVRYVSGDKNGDNQLQPGETWTYTATVRLGCTTTNIGTAKGCANGKTATDCASCTVVVTQKKGGGH